MGTTSQDPCIPAVPEVNVDASMADAMRQLGVRSHALKSLSLMIDAHNLVSLTDRAGRIVYANDKFCEVSKYSRQELLGQTHRVIRSGHHPPEFYDHIWETIRSGKVWSGDIQNRAKDGSLYWVQSTISPIYDAQNRIAGFGSVRTDVTEQRTRLARLEDSEKKAYETLRSAIDALDSGLNVYDEDAMLVISNKKSLEMYPGAREVMIPGQAATEILTKICPHLSDEELRRQVDEHMETEHLAYRELSDGRFVRITRSKTPEGGMVSVHTDITDIMQQQKLLEEQASTMDLMKAIAVDANESPDTASAYSACLKRICEFADWQVGHTYLIRDGKANRYQSGTSWHSANEQQFAAFRDVSDGIKFESGSGLPAMVLKTGEPVWLQDVTACSDFPRGEQAKRCGLVGGAAFPVRVRDEIVAVLEFFATRPLEPSERISEIMEHVCTQVGRVAERERSEKLLMTQVASELRKRDRELIEQNARFNAALKNMSHGLCMFDKDQRLIVSNQRYAELYGLSTDLLKPGITLREILQHRIDNGIFSGDSPEAYIEERLAWVTSGVQSSKVQYLTDGRAISITHQPMSDGGWLTTHEDITDRLESQKALQESQEVLAKAFGASPAAMAISHLDDGSHIEVNETWCNKLGYTREDAMAHSAVELGIWACPEDRKRFISMMRQSNSVHEYEAKLRRKDGQLIHVIVSGEIVEIGGEPRLLIVWYDITERVASERALKESQDLFSKAFRSSPVAMSISTPETGVHLDVNETWAKLFGHTREEALARTAQDLQTWVDPEDRLRFVGEMQRSGSVRGFDALMQAKDGRLIDTLLFGEMVEIDGVKRMLIVVYDVTERKKAERALRESESKFKALVESTNVVPWEFDPKTMRFTYVAPQAVALFGYDVEEWYEDGFWERFVHPDDMTQTIRLCEVASHECRDHDFEFRVIMASGQEMWVRDVVSVTTERGKTVGLRGVLIDISERKRASEALQRSEQRFKDIVEVSSDWIWECDEELRVTYVSERFYEVSGVRPEEVMGRTRHEIGKGSKADWDGHMEDLLARRPFREFKFSVEKDGKRRHWSVSGRPVFDGDGNFKGYRGTGYDRTAEVEAKAELIRHRDHLQDMVNEATAELKHRAEELRQALAKEKELNELQRQFVSMASHEFRTPLAIIDSAAQRLLRKCSAPEQRDMVKRIDKIRNAVGRMTELMESTLAAARLENGAQQIAMDECQIRSVLREVCEAQQELASEHRIHLSMGEIPRTITADTTAMRQIFTNLLSNAVKYAPDDPDIEVTAAAEGDHVVVSVRDHGVGIEKEELPKMFQRFFRASTSEGIAGTGIGLNLVKTLVELHGGSIEVESTPGGGSRFIVRLPVEGPASDAKSAGQAA